MYFHPAPDYSPERKLYRIKKPLAGNGVKIGRRPARTVVPQIIDLTQCSEEEEERYDSFLKNDCCLYDVLHSNDGRNVQYFTKKDLRIRTVTAKVVVTSNATILRDPFHSKSAIVAEAGAFG